MTSNTKKDIDSFVMVGEENPTTEHKVYPNLEPTPTEIKQDIETGDINVEISNEKKTSFSYPLIISKKDIYCTKIQDYIVNKGQCIALTGFLTIYFTILFLMFYYSQC